MTGGSDLRFVDTNVLVYAHDIDAGDKHEQARALIRELWESGRGCLSIQVLQEFFVTATRSIPTPLDIDEAAAAVEDFAQWTLHAPAPADVIDAIAIHRRFDISFWDAMIINSASKLGCRMVDSEDLNAGQQYGSVRVVNPFV
jgi:predicted nucleic acid-binding protein